MPLASRPSILALARLAVGLVVLIPVTVLVLRHGFAGLYGQDSFGYIDYALGPLRDALQRVDLPPAWPQPPGYPLFVAATSLVLGPDGRIGLAVSLITGAAVPIFTALLAGEALGDRLAGRARVIVPLVAGVAASLPGQLWQSSAVAMPDTMAVALATAGAWAACRYVRSGRAWWLFGAGAALALAVDTRWVDGLVAIGVAGVGAVGLARRWRRDRRRAAGHAAGAALVTVAVLAVVAVPIARAWLDGSAIPFVADFGAYHWDPANALRSTFETTDGRLAYDITSGAFYGLQVVQPYWFGPAGVLAILGAAWVARRGGSVATTILVGWPVLVLVFLACSPYQNTRFFLSVLPPVAILVAIGLWRAATLVDARIPVPRQRLARGVAGAIVAAWLAVAVVSAARFTDAFIVRQTDDLTSIRALESRVPESARLISMGPTGVFVFDGRPDVVELFGLSPEAAGALLADRRTSYLVIDPVAIAGQWAGRQPALTVEAIRAKAGLTPLVQAGGWTLYQIGPPAGS